MRGGRRIGSIVGCLVALGAIGAASVRAAAPAPLPPASPPGAQKLSDERTESRWAYPQRRATVYSRPSSRARKVTRLRLLTEDRFPELYLALSRWVDPKGNAWVRIRVPRRPNGIKGWVPQSALSSMTVNHRLIDVDKRALRLRVFDHGKVVMTARVGVGKRGTITPSGHFYVREKFHVKGVPLYGPRAIGTSAYAPTLSDWPGGGVVGLHGTNQPGLIPGRPSHGCIRLRNRDILRLYRLAERGTPIDIHN
jgi:lipoprotein-anchoring transpeptidase ErfK/SrfK